METEKQPEIKLLNKPGGKLPIKVYKKRWWIIFVFMYYAALNCFQWIEYSSVTHVIVKYYNVSTVAVDWTSTLYMIMYPILVIPVSYMIDKKGLRLTALFGCTGTFIGSALKVLSIRTDLFWIVLLGNAIAAASSLFIVCLPAKIASLWFKRDEVSTACSLGVLGSQIGSAIGYIIPPLLVQDQPDIEDIGSELKILNWGVALAMIPVTLAVFVYFPDAPPLPPSNVQANLRENPEEFKTSIFFQSIKKLFMNKGFLIHMLAYSINVAVNTAVATLLTQLILQFFEGADKEAGWMGFFMVVSGMFGTLTFGKILDKTHKYKEIALLNYILGATGVVLLMFTLKFQLKIMTYIACMILGMFINAYLMVGYEFGMELTFPAEESTITGILIASTQILGAIFTIVLGYINMSMGAFWSLATQAVALFIGIAATAWTPNNLLRQEAFKNGDIENNLRKASFLGSAQMCAKRSNFRMPWFEERRKQLRAAFKSENQAFDDELETEQEYKERWRSIYIIYFTMFLISLGFSIIVTGVWPYLDKLDPTAGKEFMGFVVAANPFAQMIFSPLVGWWSNRLGSIRIPMIFSLSMFLIASATYSSLELFPSYRKHWMLWSRFLVGVSSACIAACRSYLSAATKYSERTKAVSMISLAQVLGFVIGPAVQAAVVPLGGEGVWLIKDHLKLNMYTASGWINVFMTLFNIYFFFPSVFKEHKIAAKEAMVKIGKDNVKDVWKEEKNNYLGAWTIIVSFFILVFIFMLLETLATPLTMDQFAWSKSESLWYMGIIMSVGAIVAILTFTSIAPLSRRFSEVKVLIWLGFLFTVIGQLNMVPFQGDSPKMYSSEFKLSLTKYCDMVLKNKTVDVNVTEISETLLSYGYYLKTNASVESEVRNMTINCGEDLTGCPSNQEWCRYTPQLGLGQFITGYMLIAFGYPIGVTLLQTIFSKILGSRPQGVWMGLMTGAGCLSRVLGPVFVTYIYQEYGTIWTFGLTTVLLFLCQCWLIAVQKSLNLDINEVKPSEAETELKEWSKLASSDGQADQQEEINGDIGK